ncbi:MULTISPECIES: 2-C-methyl-D-erythritol 4-phosphate cytidylyltransferase [unclassified Fibrobacter]|uniref:IspD/TarI family cytidylyltransferase n=1 Tax=unclassified Fibrobacter TaxID=2634177 RepID=UPI000D6B8EE1|nr:MULTISPECIES: IspD/TarI family cytidylyltransferase [unclassified Fibrobacter]PWJ61061.1 2-C-methyl-D-erythritol 4-phosphate cytidylyltransferase [Fibrobacter sp. UWR4]PZW68082.1 2-C-methyl-D-erythritol 4-phosphate cytidylyltransferase [Fibrobacter sp. UWR1]
MNIALLTAGGVGNRMGQDIPKQFMCIDNQPVIIYTMQAFQYHPEIDAIAVVCLPGWSVILQAYANQYNITKLKWIFDGADSNQGSIYNGITGLKKSGCSDDDIILVHDGVRPLVDPRIITDNIATCKEFGYAVTGLTCKEAIMELVGQTVTDIDIPRERLVRTQTPHTYKLSTLLEAHQKAISQGITDTVASCTLLALTGVKNQHIVEGSEKNGLKLTRPQDVDLFKALIHTNPEPWMK